ncbi:hypothetical protein WMY93_022886 [Mugilogobius chulae]|uniref:Uncharacterized protein n=1 Tax=Mugilogobius chulae TaxID=88201 RepID=A0AAW0N2T1_9GOBI
MEQSWHKPRTMGVKPGRVRDMVFVSSKPKQRTVGDGVRSTRYKALSGDGPDPSVLNVSEVYKDFPADIAPFIASMAISADVPLVESAYGKVQEGSPISFQHPLPASRVVTAIQMPTTTTAAFGGLSSEATTVQFVCTHQQQLHLKSLATPLDLARKLKLPPESKVQVRNGTMSERPELILKVPRSVSCPRA